MVRVHRWIRLGLASTAAFFAFATIGSAVTSRDATAQVCQNFYDNDCGCFCGPGSLYNDCSTFFTCPDVACSANSYCLCCSVERK
jgi:hypothetical protein